MIIFFSEGRLGNQLFQYSFLSTLAKKNEAIYCFNVNELVEAFTLQNTMFKAMPTGLSLRFLFHKIILPYILTPLSNIKMIGAVSQEKLGAISLPTYKVQKGLLPVFFVRKGFFQSEKFFDVKKVRLIIKKEFEDKAKTILGTLPSDKNKVFIHVRRGDYISQVFLGEKGIDLPKSYYEKAIKIIEREIPEPFFVFLSDDPSYVACCFEDIKNKYISQNSMQVDLALMSLCEYGIVSNSSFSWWGAYLMKNRKRVFFPKYWYGWKKGIESHPEIQPSWGEMIEVI